MARNRKPVTDIIVSGLEGYLAAYDVQIRLEGDYFFFKQGIARERYLTTRNRNALQLLKMMASKLQIPFLFQATSGKFKGSIGNVRISGYSYSQVKLLHGKDVLQGNSIAKFLEAHQLDATATGEFLTFDQASIPKDAFGTLIEIDDLVLINRRVGMIVEWDPLKERARINFGTSIQWVDLAHEFFVNMSQIDQAKIRQQLMIKRLMKK